MIRGVAIKKPAKKQQNSCYIYDYESSEHYCYHSKNGFTFLEFLIVVGIIALLVGIITVAINPARQYAQARNDQREIHLYSIFSAVEQYARDNRELPEDINTTLTEICREGVTCPAEKVDLSVLVLEDYLTEIPKDPQCADDTGTGYYIKKHSITGRLEIEADCAELGRTIKVGF